jgi:hypothetical protein
MVEDAQQVRLAELESENATLRNILEKAMDTIESLTEALAESQTAEAQDSFLVSPGGTKLDVDSFDQWYSQCFSEDPTLPSPRKANNTDQKKRAVQTAEDGGCSTPPDEPDTGATRHLDQELFESTVSQLQELQDLCNSTDNNQGKDDEPETANLDTKEGMKEDTHPNGKHEAKDAKAGHKLGGAASVEQSIGKCIAILQSSFSHGAVRQHHPWLPPCVDTFVHHMNLIIKQMVWMWEEHAAIEGQAFLPHEKTPAAATTKIASSISATSLPPPPPPPSSSSAAVPVGAAYSAPIGAASLRVNSSTAVVNACAVAKAAAARARSVCHEADSAIAMAKWRILWKLPPPGASKTDSGIEVQERREGETVQEKREGETSTTGNHAHDEGLEVQPRWSEEEVQVAIVFMRRVLRHLHDQWKRSAFMLQHILCSPCRYITTNSCATPPPFLVC